MMCCRMIVACISESAFGGGVILAAGTMVIWPGRGRAINAVHGTCCCCNNFVSFINAGISTMYNLLV